MNRLPFYLFVAALVLVGVALSLYRHSVYGVPWFPGEQREQWEIEARIEFTANGDPAKVAMAIPNDQQNFILTDESSSSQGYGVAILEQKEQRKAEWSIRSAEGQQLIYYKARFLADADAQYQIRPPSKPRPQYLEDVRQTAALSMLQDAMKRSADNPTLARELIRQLNDVQNQNAALLLNSMNREDALVSLLSMEAVPARTVATLMLEDGRRRQSVQPWVQVWDEQKEQWQLFNPRTGAEGKPDNLLIWSLDYQSLLDVIGGRQSDVSFSMIAQDISPETATREKIEANDLLNFSIHSLPVEEQAMFKTIMLIPVGALLVVFLRIIVGLKTSGTFMPVLIAVAFVQTELVPGIIGFLLIVGTGLMIRSYLSRLNLLLVARISAVIIAVIMIISVFTVVAYRVGLLEGLSITFFPMIILSWTIERMSILWEEEGAKEVFVQGGGSLLTAVLVYLAMTSELVRHLTFNFVGLQLIILALILLLGNYTGYRLSELRRFRHLAQD
ncbi:inactive transglutaminase family protein [Oceanospirillum sanctuarii]|uniref:inactive transglutaminase family protein n=1 Tax=Oceanospirillum sanctuarii TaxID=1434821 RepID=UPI001C3C7ACA|nr:inactive transglutaminase family protein [Oceanospirillum sanctuarii]